MEKENKIEEKKIEKVEDEKTERENKIEEVKAEKAEAKPESKKHQRRECYLKKCCKNKTALSILILIVLIGASAAYKYWPSKNLGPDAAKTKLEKFINENLMQPGTTATIKDLTVEGGLYKVIVNVGTQEITTYMTKDGSKFFPQAIDVNAAKKEAAPQVAEKTEAEQKTDVPTVDLFVMSYCPYGLQMERGVLPAIEALGNKVKFNLKFVSYTLHGQKEVDENVRQYCTQKTQPAKLDNYLKCFWKDSKGSGDACMKSVGINATEVNSCIADTNKQFNPTEKAFDLDKEENVKFGVQGSPTLVVNGTTISSSRDSASVLKAICTGFTNQPKECNAKLSTTSPTAGFDDQAAGNGGGAGAPASCH